MLWLVAGVHRVEIPREFAVVEARGWGVVATVERAGFALAPPGFFRLTEFPGTPTSVPLPGAALAMLASPDGSRYGLVGSTTVRALPERANALAAAAGGDGIDGVVLDAIRSAASVFDGVPAQDRTVPTLLRAFEARLGAELARRGAEMSDFDLQGFDVLGAAGDVAPVIAAAKVLIVGLDGADWEIIDPLIAAGRMPHLARLVDAGARAKLLTITPVLSPVIWTSMATGVEPARHGVLDFLTTNAAGESEPVSARERLVPTVWEMLSAVGVPVGITAWWATWPAEPVDGYVVTDRVAYQLFGYRSDVRSAQGKTWPPGLYESEVRRRIVPPGDVPWSEVASYLEGPRRREAEFDAEERKLLDEFRTLLASGRTYLDVALALRTTADVRFEAVYLEGTDTIGHLFMPYRAPRLPSVSERRFASFRSMVDRYYETADAMLGRLLEGREDWVVLVVSDHGFASDATRPLTSDSRIGHGAAADWHRRFGILVASGPGIRKGVRIEEASIYDIAPTVLALFGQPVPRSWPGRVLGGALAPALLAEHPVRFRRSDPVRRGEAGEDSAGNEEADELKEKLRNLGYLGAQATTGSMTTMNNRGVALLAEGKYDDAAAAFRKAIAEEPDQATLWVNLGIALRHSGHVDDARVLFERARSQPDARRAAGHQLAQILMERGDFRGAERELRGVLEVEPGAAEVRNALGLVLEKGGDPRGAKAQYAEAARLDPNAAEPRNNLGNIAKAERKWDEAIRWYESAIAADPYFMGAYNNLALLYQERGEVDRAIRLYGRALAKAPKNAVVMNNLGSLYYATADYAAAQDLWQRSVEADPEYASPVNNLAGLALARGDLQRADELLVRALELDPNYGDARINRAIVARRRGDAPAARREIEAALRDPRAHGTALTQLGFLELEEGNFEASAGALEKARAEVGDRVDLLNALGEAHARQGNSAEAVSAWQASLRVDPQQLRLHEAIKQIIENK